MDRNKDARWSSEFMVLTMLTSNDREFWEQLNRSPRAICRSARKGQLLDLLLHLCHVAESEALKEGWRSVHASVKRIPKKELTELLIKGSERARMDALCDRRGAVLHTRELREARDA